MALFPPQEPPERLAAQGVSGVIQLGKWPAGGSAGKVWVRQKGGKIVPETRTRSQDHLDSRFPSRALFERETKCMHCSGLRHAG